LGSSDDSDFFHIGRNSCNGLLDRHYMPFGKKNCASTHILAVPSSQFPVKNQ
jgi:hypothetical protein